MSINTISYLMDIIMELSLPALMLVIPDTWSMVTAMSMDTLTSMDIHTNMVTVVTLLMFRITAFPMEELTNRYIPPKRLLPTLALKLSTSSMLLSTTPTVFLNLPCLTNMAMVELAVTEDNKFTLRALMLILDLFNQESTQDHTAQLVEFSGNPVSMTNMVSTVLLVFAVKPVSTINTAFTVKPELTPPLAQPINKLTFIPTLMPKDTTEQRN